MGVGITSLVLLVISLITVLILFFKLRRKEAQSQQHNIHKKQFNKHMELSPPKSSPHTATGDNNPPRQENDNSGEYDVVVSTTSKAGLYETVHAQEKDDQDHIYSKI